MSQPDRWDAAATIGAHLAGPGLKGLSRAEIDAVVAGLHAAAARAPRLIAEATHLPLAPEPEVNVVVDRRGIIRANLATSRRVLETAARANPDVKVDDVTPPPAVLGAVLAALATRILGQFDPFGTPPRLLLVAPNIVRTERALGANPDDFRLWVCLHEQTHRAQFGAAPWLVDHLLGLVSGLMVAEESNEPGSSLPQRLRAARAATRDKTAGRPTSLGLVTALSDPKTRDILNAVTATMSLLEGYADVMMDEAGPDVIATLPSIRAAFDQHRAKKGLSAMVGKLLGMDAKLAQYTEGAAFCRAVIAGSDLDTLNLVYSTPANLPSVEELRAPQQWLDRIAEAQREAARLEAERARLLAEAAAAVDGEAPADEPERMSRLRRWWRARHRGSDEAVSDG